MEKIRCEKSLCIYEKNGFCILDEIEINVLGMCSECIIPNFDNYYVETMKEKTLKTLNDEWLK